MTIVDKIHPKIEKIIPEILEKKIKYRQELENRRTYALNDTIDISAIPRVIGKDEHNRISMMTSSLAHSAFSYLSDCIENKDSSLISDLNDILSSFNPSRLDSNKLHFSGNGRFDFLKQGDSYKLIEMNMVNVSALAYGHQPMAALFDMFPDLKNDFYYLYPPSAMKTRVNQRNIGSMLILTKSKSHKDYSDCALNDWQLISEHLVPVDVNIVQEDRFNELKFIDKNLFYCGKRYDAVYLRYLDGPESLNTYRKLAQDLLLSNTIIFDNFLTMYLEDKDLSITTKYNPDNEIFIPKGYSINELLDTDMDTFPDIVLKIKDMHSGKGVYISPTRNDLMISNKSIAQEKCYPNLFPVNSIQGLSGNAMSDIAVFISYDYDAKLRVMNSFDVSGYLSRFTFDNDKTNICQGGGIIPVLIEK